VPYTLVDRNKRERELLDEVKRIVDILRTQDIEQVILFGSLAAKYPSSCGDAASPVESEAPRGREAVSRGADAPCGDIDLIVIQDTTKRFLDRLDDIYSAVRPRKALDVLVYTSQELESLRESSPFVRRALAEGRVLYAKDSS